MANFGKIDLMNYMGNQKHYMEVNMERLLAQMSTSTDTEKILEELCDTFMYLVLITPAMELANQVITEVSPTKQEPAQIIHPGQTHAE